MQRNWRCAVKGRYLLLPAAPMPQQYRRLALAVRCDETAPGKGASRQNDQPLQARLLADPSGSRSGTVGLCRSEFRTGFRTGFRFRLRHPVSADPLWRSGSLSSQTRRPRESVSDGSGGAEEEPAAAWRSFALVLEVRDSRVRDLYITRP